MKKYFIMIFVFTLILSSCGTKTNEKKFTGTTSLDEVTSSTNSLDIIEKQEKSSGNTESLYEEHIEFGEIIESGDEITYKDNYKGYEVKFRKTEDLILKNDYMPLDFIAISGKNSIGFVFEELPKDYSNFEDFFAEKLKINKSIKGINNFQESDIETNGLKGKKISYNYSDGTYIEENTYFKNDKIFTVALRIGDKKTEKQFLDISKSFSFFK